MAALALRNEKALSGTLRTKKPDNPVRLSLCVCVGSNQLKLFTCAASFDFRLLALFW